MKLPPNTSVNHGSFRFRKKNRYTGEVIERSWPIKDGDKAMREIYDLLARMEKNEKVILELEHRMMMDEACDTYFTLHSPNLKETEGMPSYTQPSYKLKSRLKKIKAFWAGRFFDTITKFDVRDFLDQFETVGTRMRYIGCLGSIFNSFKEWNEEGNILKVKVKLPQHNPVLKWRKKMKPVEKRELPDTRVLSQDEWNQFKQHLNPRARQICEIAVRRLLRKSDIKNINFMSIKGTLIEGVQAKTGEPFKIPVLADQPTTYDFTNFEKDFRKAQVMAGLDYPADHPLHFSMKDLRRTGATWLYRETKDLVGIGRLLGHRKISTTIRYLGLDDADLTSLAQVADNLANSEGNTILSKPLSKTTEGTIYKTSNSD